MKKKVKIYNNKDSWSFGIDLMTPYEDDGKGNDIHIAFFNLSIWIRLPEFIKPKKHFVDCSMYEWAQSGGYWESIQKKYGIMFHNHGVHIHYGIQPNCWINNDPKNSDHTKVIWYPWNYEHCRSEAFSLDGSQSWNHTKRDSSEWYEINDIRYQYDDRKEAWECYNSYPKIYKYETYIDKYDGTEIQARYHIEEMEWRRFKLPFLKKVRRYIDIDFNDEVGPRKSSWKGGTIGLGFDMNKNETHEEAWKRFCKEYVFK